MNKRNGLTNPQNFVLAKLWDGTDYLPGRVGVVRAMVEKGYVRPGPLRGGFSITEDGRDAFRRLKDAVRDDFLASARGCGK